MVKVFIDGSEGTTGLRIDERIKGRDDIKVLKIDPEKRKDPEEKRKLINESDYTFLCLPDAASVEDAKLIDPDNTRTVIIDASTAHRTDPDWAYGLPELEGSFREKIKQGRKIAVPGCYASGFMMIVYPLVKEGIIPADYPLCCTALSGYSGAGKKAIEMYEGDGKTEDLFAPREYALSQQHKHLKEMKAIAGLSAEPAFIPIVDDYYSGMIVNIPLFSRLMNKKMSPEQLRDFYFGYYKNEKFINVREYGAESEGNGFLAANKFSGRDDAEIFVTGNEERILISARFDNLGKGASGAAMQCLNIKLGCDEGKGLIL